MIICNHFGNVFSCASSSTLYTSHSVSRQSFKLAFCFQACELVLFGWNTKVLHMALNRIPTISYCHHRIIYLCGWYVRMLSQAFDIVQKKLCTVRKLILICPSKKKFMRLKKKKEETQEWWILMKVTPEEGSLDARVSPKSWDHLRKKIKEDFDGDGFEEWLRIEGNHWP